MTNIARVLRKTTVCPVLKANVFYGSHIDGEKKKHNFSSDPKQWKIFQVMFLNHVGAEMNKKTAIRKGKLIS